jgi:hypothetical protein
MIEPTPDSGFDCEAEARLFEHARRSRTSSHERWLDFQTLLGGACGLPVPQDVIDRWKRLLRR